MKVKTIRAFRDLETNKNRMLDEEFEVSKERFEEILKAGLFVEEIKTPKKKTPNKKKGD